MISLTAPQRFTLGVLGAALLALGTHNSAQAAVLVDNGAPDFRAAIRSDFDLPVEAGDDFTFTTNNDVTKITWSGLYASKTLVSTAPSIDQFSVRIFEFLNDRPAIAPVAAFNDVTVSRSSTANPFFFSYSFAPVQPLGLKAGKYLLSVVNNTQVDTTLDWFWARSNETGNDFGRFQPDDAWFDDLNNTAELSFAIEGAPTPVPTPALLPGLIGLGVSVWRKRKLAANGQSTGIS